MSVSSTRVAWLISDISEPAASPLLSAVAVALVIASLPTVRAENCEKDV